MATAYVPARLILLLLPVLILAQPVTAASIRLTELGMRSSDSTTKVTIQLTGAAAMHSFGLREPLRAVIDLSDVVLSTQAVVAAPPADSVVRGIRHGVQPDRKLRLVFDLKEPAVVTEAMVLHGDSPAATLHIVFSPPDAAPQPDTTADSTPEVKQAPATDAGTAFTFGSSRPSPQADRTATTTAAGSAWDLRLQRGLAETGLLSSDSRPVDGLVNLQLVASASRAFDNGLELRLGGRLDGHYEFGSGATAEVLEADYDETWLRYRGADWRLTVGAQKVFWGRSDEIPPTDRLSTGDFTRLMLDDRADRRRANPALRLEWFAKSWSADLLWLPVFREGEMPDQDSIWYPVDRASGRIMGLPENPALATLVRSAEFAEGASGDGGGGLRVNRFGRGFDYALTVQRARMSQPYFRLDDATRQAILSGSFPAFAPVAEAPRFEAIHPRSWVVGGDAGIALGTWTLRAEAAWSSDLPITRDNLEFDTVPGWHWVLGAETFPGDGNLRLTLQMAGMHLQDAADALDQDSMLSLLGELESPFRENRWRWKLRYWLGLEQRELYLNPELAWVALEPHEFYLGLHLFDGRDTTVGGFYDQRDMLVFGWRGRF